MEINPWTSLHASIRKFAMLQREFMGAFDIKPDRVAFASR
jgi:hypothetical protein